MALFVEQLAFVGKENQQSRGDEGIKN